MLIKVFLGELRPGHGRVDGATHEAESDLDLASLLVEPRVHRVPLDLLAVEIACGTFRGAVDLGLRGEEILLPIATCEQILVGIIYTGEQIGFRAVPCVEFLLECGLIVALALGTGILDGLFRCFLVPGGIRCWFEVERIGHGDDLHHRADREFRRLAQIAGRRRVLARNREHDVASVENDLGTGNTESIDALANDLGCLLHRLVVGLTAWHECYPCSALKVDAQLRGERTRRRHERE